jgi:hypothetical protein
VSWVLNYVGNITIVMGKLIRLMISYCGVQITTQTFQTTNLPILHWQCLMNIKNYVMFNRIEITIWEKKETFAIGNIEKFRIGLNNGVFIYI